MLASDDWVSEYYSNNIEGQEDSLRTFKVLQLSDMHVDINYLQGASVECRGFVCCHIREGEQLDSVDLNLRAGPYGDSNCDISIEGAT